MEEIGALLEKAARNFDVAGLVLEAGSPDIAASRAYYGYFYVAEALLLSEGLRFSSHGQVAGQYGLRFAKTDLLDRRFHRLMRDAFVLRQTADYDAWADVGSGEVRRLIAGGKEFLEGGAGSPAGSPEGPRERPERSRGARTRRGTGRTRPVLAYVARSLRPSGRR